MTAAQEQEAYPVRVVAEQLGMPVATLRSWNQRYGIGPQQHRSGRHRLYLRADIEIAAQMLALVRSGVTPASAARAVNPVRAVTRPADCIDTLLDAAFHLDSTRVIDVLESQLLEHGVVDTWEDLCRPAFADIVTRQGCGEGCIDVEHLLSWAIINTLHRVSPAPHRVAHGAVVLACAPGEFHSLPIEVLRAALAETGVHADMFGASLPAAALSDALARLSRRSTAVVWSHSPETADRELLAIASTAQVCPAGPGWIASDLPPGTRLLRTLPEALSELHGDSDGRQSGDD
ncbi:MerR family transcriptional regulator [Nocardia sp. KC 131]|uniref:MerR family transcriptional regulator n=1 Tax=Nocardia arseniciresistens TaxID=3392119 RepID=UPI00398E34E2